MELKPCPFCGSTEIDYGICTGTLRGFGYVQCEDCGAEISKPTKCQNADTAIEAWNRRADNGDKIEKELEQEANEIESLKRQLQTAAIFAESQPHCPDGKDCDGTTSEKSCIACWLEYWKRQAEEG